MWLVLVTKGKVHRVHSIHFDESSARMWANCKLHDGDDAAIASVDLGVMDEIERFIEESKVIKDAALRE